MGKGGKISEYRERLDKTLASPQLKNRHALQTLVKDQLLRSSIDKTEGCSDAVLDVRTNQVSLFLDMLRSASVTDNEVKETAGAPHGGWKLKEDNEEFRVMYRPGPQGTPLHTLLVEGYVDAPVHTCLCVSWESALYPKWWPQYTFPPFKITICKCLQKIRIGEHISLMRVKITWPLTAREAVVHYFLFEYLQDELVVVLFNTVSDSEDVDKTTHGFTKEDIPEAKDVIRIDAVGGFALQKVTSERSYFRTIGNVDVKLEFVPPSLINFIARQLIGNGFRFYQKTVASVANHDTDYRKILEDPMYARIQEALYSSDKPNGITEKNEPMGDVYSPLQELRTGVIEKNLGVMDQNVCGDANGIESLPANAQNLDQNCFYNVDGETGQESSSFNDETRVAGEEVDISDNVNEDMQHNASATGRTTFCEIEEEETDDTRPLDMSGNDLVKKPSSNRTARKAPVNYKNNVRVSPEVKNALETLEKAISTIREFGFNEPGRSLTQNLGKDAEVVPAALQDVSSNNEVSTEVADKETITKRTSHESGGQDIRRPGSNSLSREGNHNRIKPESPEGWPSVAGESNQTVLCPPNTGKQERTEEIAVIDLTTQDIKKSSSDINGIEGNSLQEGKKSSRKKRHMLSCFSGFLSR